MANELSLFFRQMVRKPIQISALAPSSKGLARKMAMAVPPGTGPVLELGPGTGKITAALIAAGIAPTDITALEMNPEFCDHLRAKFPQVDFRNMSAADIETTGKYGARAVVSGLPLLSMPYDVQRDILRGAFALLGPDGVFVQFTYGPRPSCHPRLQAEMNLQIERLGWVLNNLPPAQVHIFRLPD